MSPKTECALRSELTVALCIISAEITAPEAQPVDMGALAQARDALIHCVEAMQSDRVRDLEARASLPTSQHSSPDDVYVLTRTFGGRTEMLWGGDDYAVLRRLGDGLERSEGLGHCFVSTVHRWNAAKYPAIERLL